MKKYICLILTGFLCLSQLIIFIGFPLSQTTAIADARYLRVINERTVFYSDANESSALFYLPYTYYVKSLGEVSEFIHVECYGTGSSPALDGYVKKQDLYDDGLSVTNPFVNLSITTATTSVLYSDSSLKVPLQYVFPERTMRYYGSYLCEDKNVFYVEYNGKLGYVKETDVYPFAIANHPNELTFLPKEEPEQPTDSPTETPKETEEDYISLKIIIIICLLFAGFVSLFIALKHKPNGQIATSYYDENDYE